MSSARLLVPVFISCSLLAVAQTQKPGAQPSAKPVDIASSANLSAKAVTSSEPWRIISREFHPPQDPLGQLMNNPVPNYRIEHGSGVQILQGFGSDNTVASLDGYSADTTCFAIRSYVVARDSKHSDSTHPVAYSTCQPATRYRLRTTVIETAPKE